MSESLHRPLLIVISAPSGGGKTTVCQQLLATNPGMTRAVTCTTRAPRTGEKDGVDYNFLTRERFLERVGEGGFLEHAQVYGNLYGTLKSTVLDRLSEGLDVLLSVDVQGVESICARAREDAVLGEALVTVFITPASLGTLEERLKRRNQDAEDVIARRLAMAREEIARWPAFDYLLISRTIPEDLRRMQTIVDAEKMKSRRSLFSPAF